MKYVKYYIYLFILVLIPIILYLFPKKENFVSTETNMLPDGVYAMRRNKKKWCADDSGRVNCNRSWIRKWEKFELKNLGNNIIQLKGGRIGKTCRLKYDTHYKEYKMVCDSSGIWPTKVWKIVKRGNLFYLRSVHHDMECSVFNNKRLVCEKNKIKFYQHSNFKGDFRTYRTGENISSIGSFNDKPSSIIVPGGVTVELYKHNNYRKPSLVRKKYLLLQMN